MTDITHGNSGPTLKGFGPEHGIQFTVTELGQRTYVLTPVAQDRGDAVLTRSSTITTENGATVLAFDETGEICPLTQTVGDAVNFPLLPSGEIQPRISAAGGVIATSRKHGTYYWSRRWKAAPDADVVVQSPFKTGSLAKHINESTEALFVGLTASNDNILQFTTNNFNVASPSVVRNPNSFLKDFDMTGLSVINSLGAANENPAGSNASPCLISPRHCLMCGHWRMGIGTSLVFQDSLGVYHTRTVTHQAIVPNITDVQLGFDSPGFSLSTDLGVMTLNADLPATVKPYKIMPANWQRYLQMNRGTLWPGQTEVADHMRLLAIGRSPWDGRKFFVHKHTWSLSVQFGVWLTATIGYRELPVGDPLYPWTHAVRGGDSGSPEFLLINGEIVLAGTHFTAGAMFTPGSFVSTLQGLMNASAPGYTLTHPDLSSFITLDMPVAPPAFPYPYFPDIPV